MLFGIPCEAEISVLLLGQPDDDGALQPGILGNQARDGLSQNEVGDP